MRCSIVLLALFSLIVSGCASKHSIEKVSIPYKNESLDQAEIQELLVQVLAKKGYHPCIEEKVETEVGFSNNYLCYTSLSTRGLITSHNMSKAKGMGKYVKPTYSDEFLTKVKETGRIVEGFEQDVEAYIRFKEKEWPRLKAKLVDRAASNYQIEYAKVKHGIQSVQVVLLDNNLLPHETKTLYEKRLNLPKYKQVSGVNLDYGMVLSNRLSPVNFFMMSDAAKQRLSEYAAKRSSLAKAFTCKLSTEYAFIIDKENKERYRVKFDPAKGIEKECSSFDPIQHVKLVELKYNFMPKTFSLNDKYLTVSLNEGALFIKNHSDSYITVEKISLYIRASVITENVKYELPPRSSRKVLANYRAEFSLNSNYEKITSRKQERNFGIALGYIKAGNSTQSTLFRSETYKME